MLPYNYELVHTPSISNPADYFSRHPVDPPPPDCDDADIYVNFIVDNSIPKSITRHDIAEATKVDKELQLLIKAIKLTDRRLVKSTPSEYNSIFDQLTVSEDGLILRSRQIVIPESLRKPLVEIAHEGHLGIVKTKKIMRLKVWFPRLDKIDEDKIGNYLACQASTPSNSKDMIPMQSEPVPDSVWHTVAGDFFGPLPSGHYFFVLICKTSGFPIVETVTTTSAKATIPYATRYFRNLEFQLRSVPIMAHHFKEMNSSCIAITWESIIADQRHFGQEAMQRSKDL